MTSVELVPLDAGLPSYGPYICKRFSVSSYKFTAILEDSEVLTIVLDGHIYTLQAESVARTPEKT